MITDFQSAYSRSWRTPQGTTSHDSRRPQSPLLWPCSPTHHLHVLEMVIANYPAPPTVKDVCVYLVCLLSHPRGFPTLLFLVTSSNCPSSPPTHHQYVLLSSGGGFSHFGELLSFRGPCPSILEIYILLNFGLFLYYYVFYCRDVSFKNPEGYRENYFLFPTER